MQTTLMQPSDGPDWDAFVHRHPDATFYHHLSWKKIIETCFKHDTYYLLAKDQGQVQGILPLVHIKSLLFGSFFCSMPFLNFGGICATNESAAMALLDFARQILQDNKADYIELRHIHKTKADLPFKTHKVSMTLELDKDPNYIWNTFKSKHRTNIRRAEKHGLTIQSGGMELLRDFYRIICQGWRDLGTPIYQYGFFENIIKEFGHAVEVFVVYYNKQPIATAFNGRFKDTVEGMWTYALRNYIRLQTNNFLYWKMVEKACFDGFKFYHLGRSTSQSGSIAFKKKWNAYPTQLYWEYVLNRKKDLPNLSADNPRLQLFRKSWQNLPVVITQAIGPLIARSLP